jgi:hypothetical protein
MIFPFDSAMNTDLRVFGIVSLAVFLFPATLKAQDALAGLPSLPTGFSEAPPSAPTSLSSSGAADEQSLNWNFGLSTLYDSNVRQGNDTAARPNESDFSLTPNLNLNYLRKSSLWQFGSQARLSYQYFLENDDFNQPNYSLGLFGGYQSTRLVASFSSDLSSSSGFNRFTGSFIEQLSYSTGILASYRLSGKTSFLASWNQQNIESETTGFEDTSSTTLGLSALWRVTPLINIGPGMRYGLRSGGNANGDFTVLGPTFRFDYQLATRVKLRSSVGVDFSESPDNDDERLMNWSLSLDYERSSLWGLGLSMIQDTQATFITGGGFDQTSSYRLNYRRKIRNAHLRLDLSYEVRDPQGAPQMVSGIRDFNFLSYGASLSFPVFGDHANFATNVTWRDQSAEDDGFSWEGFQWGANLGWKF